MFVFWYCIDDAIAKAVNVPGLGEIPFWVWCVICVPSIVIVFINAILKAATS
jgi:hypothetical protein